MSSMKSERICLFFFLMYACSFILLVFLFYSYIPCDDTSVNTEKRVATKLAERKGEKNNYMFSRKLRQTEGTCSINSTKLKNQKKTKNHYFVR